MKANNQFGFAHLGLLLVVLVVAAVSFAGYRVWQSRDAAEPIAASNLSLPATIKTKADLTQTGKFLDQTNVQLDSNLNTSSLDKDIDNLL
jgi:hypothetical protein